MAGPQENLFRREESRMGSGSVNDYKSGAESAMKVAQRKNTMKRNESGAVKHNEAQ